MLFCIAAIAIAQPDAPVFPAASRHAAGQCAVGMDELMARIRLPMRGLTSAGDDDARPLTASRSFDRHRRGQVHQGRDSAKNSRRVINQTDQLSNGRLSPEIDHAVQSGMVMSPLPDLDELDFAAEMIDDRLIASRVPPFDGHIVLAAGGDDPKRNGFTRDLVDLREPGFLLRGQVNVSFEQSGLYSQPKLSVEELDKPMNGVIRRFIAKID